MNFAIYFLFPVYFQTHFRTLLAKSLIFFNLLELDK